MRWVLGCAALLALVACSTGDGAPPAGSDSGMPNTVVPATDDGGDSDDGGTDGGDGGDGGSTDWCDVSVCDPASPTSCGAGSCKLLAETPSCEMPGGKAVDESCDANDDCGPGLGCFRRGDSGVCATVCCAEGTNTCVGEGERCGGSGILVDGTQTQWRACIKRRDCDVLDAAAMCDDGEGCYVVSSAGLTDCLPEGVVAVGEPCAVRNDCEPGALCLGLADRTCRRVCELSDGIFACPEDEGTCEQYAYSPAGTGVCTVD